MSQLTWITPPGSIGIYAEDSSMTFDFEATPGTVGNKVTYTLLNGSLVFGSGSTLAVTTAFIGGKWIGKLQGTTGSILSDTTNEFTIRATETLGTVSSTVVSIRDRTFSMTVSGESLPDFTTPQGLLITTNDSTWVTYQINYTNTNTSSAATVRLVAGLLPPGLEINSSGLIRGYALPPQGVAQRQYEFTLELDNASGSVLGTYSIIVVNQEYLPGFNGRAPALLNAQPLSFTIDPNSVNSFYYITGSSIGKYIQDDKFIFKFIGYNFNDLSENGITYTIIGLDNAVTLENLSSSVTTGWYQGVVKEVGKSVQTYNLVIRVSVPGIAPGTTLTSPDIVLSMTVVGDIATDITWLTDSDLGVINNGSVSEFAVRASSPGPIKYRIIGKDVSTNIKTIVKTTATAPNTDFLTFGDLGTWAKGVETTPPVPSTWSWTSQTPVTTVFNDIYFNASTYLSTAITPTTVVVGRNQSFNGIVYKYTAPQLSLQVVSPPNGSRSLTDVIQSDTRVITIGSKITSTGYTGCVFYSLTLDNLAWTEMVLPTIPSITGNYQLNSLFWTGSRYIAVGDSGVILITGVLGSSDDIGSAVWTASNSTTTNDLQSVIWTGHRYIAVGNNGVILTCDEFSDPSPANWIWVISAPYGTTLNKILINGNVILAAGNDGVIITSTETTAPQLSWTLVENIISTSNLYDVIVNNDKFYLVGDVGTILICEFRNDIQRFTLSSPTLNLPPNLTLLPNGDIAGKLAFESQKTVSAQNLNTTYSFVVQAYNTTFENISSNKTFSITVNQKYYYPYDNIYMQLMPGKKYQNAVYELCNSSSLVKREYLYRPDDANFGHQNQVIFWHTYGLPSVGDVYFYDEYIAAVQKNFYWRNLVLGPLRTAEARDSNDNVIYEVVYSEIVDDLINKAGVSISKDVLWPRKIPVDNSDYWASTQRIYDNATYYDKLPVAHRIVAIDPTDNTKFTLDTVDGLYYIDKQNAPTNIFCDVTGGPGVTVAQKEINVPLPAPDPILYEPPQVSNVNRLTNEITIDTAQPGLKVGDELVFSYPAFTGLTSELSTILYPASTDNMRDQLFDYFGTLKDDTVLPKWMTSKQSSGRTLGYVPAYVIAYAKPGFAAAIKRDIETNWPYKLNDIQFEVDRIIVDRSLTYDYLGKTIGPFPPFPGWTGLPSAQPYPSPVDSKNTYIYYPQQTILPGVKRQ